jgi:hypothetical protein
MFGKPKVRVISVERLRTKSGDKEVEKVIRKMNRQGYDLANTSSGFPSLGLGNKTTLTFVKRRTPWWAFWMP